MSETEAEREKLSFLKRRADGGTHGPLCGRGSIMAWYTSAAASSLAGMGSDDAAEPRW